MNHAANERQYKQTNVFVQGSLPLLPWGKRGNPRDEVEEELVRSRVSDFNLVSSVSLLPVPQSDEALWGRSYVDFFLGRIDRYSFFCAASYSYAWAVSTLFDSCHVILRTIVRRPPATSWPDMKRHTYPGAYALHKSLITILTGRLGLLEVSFQVKSIVRALMNVYDIQFSSSLSWSCIILLPRKTRKAF